MKIYFDWAQCISAYSSIVSQFRQKSPIAFSISSAYDVPLKCCDPWLKDK